MTMIAMISQRISVPIKSPDIFLTSPIGRFPRGAEPEFQLLRPMALKRLTCSVSARSTGRRSIDDAP